MSEIHGLAEARQLLGSFHWHELSTLRRLCFGAIATGSGCYLDLDLEAVEAKPRFALTLRFDGAQRLKLSELSCPETRVTGFYVDDIRDRQWERLHWEVGDFENDALHFYCESIRILSVTLLDTGERLEIQRDSA